MECTKDTTQDTGPDQLQQSVATGWATFLAAQHWSREVDSLRRSLNEHIKQTSTQHELLSVAVVQSKPSSPVTEASLENHLESLRQEMTESMSQLSQKITSHEERTEHLRSLTSDDIKDVQEKYLSALGMVEYLQGELRDMRSDKVNTENKLTALERDTENKLTALGRQIAALLPPQTPLPDEAVSFLNQLVSRRAEVMRILSLPCHEEFTQLQQTHVTGATANPEHTTIPTNPPRLNNTNTTPTSASSITDIQIHVPDRRQRQNTVSKHSQPYMAVITRKQPKRKAAEPPQTQPSSKRAMPPGTSSTKTSLVNPPKTVPADAQDTKDLYHRFRSRYDTNPPQDQVRGIWRFINQIKNPDVAKHLQESLVISLPEYVKLGSRSRLATQVNGVQRIFITISGKVTWKMFSEAFDKYAALHLKE
ncbi:uncharacterized protein QC761_0013440 [Podospora bellae-mahoneyi]|uniref:Uncharacterized protein n=1 Tax=Podospora bellae-mahoneyi TaxID=2093777 RepID=A0ABR0FYX1_9PEZI|nr:hypothetical protein QC761_0013440 [Podospora bellae-mahoneyi]